MNFIYKNKLFSLLYFLTTLITLIAVYQLGFGEAAHQIAGAPERLRNITFFIWDNYTSSKHGYLVFNSLDDFNKKIAYSNHSTAYLFYMYMLYKIELLIPAFQMRVIGAMLNMISLAGAVFYIISNVTNKSISFIRAPLILLAVIFMVSMPGYWISAARFNVDNSHPLIFTLLVLTSFFIWQDKGAGKRIWISILIFSIFSPISAAILGLALSLCSLRNGGVNAKLFKVAMVAVFLGCILYLQAPAVSKMLGFAASNSGWAFRSGLDGDTRYFSNALMSIISPKFPPRPFHIIAPTILLLLAQVAYFRIAKGNTKSHDSTHLDSLSSSNAGIFYFLIFSQYIFILILWPQAVAIHHYLYDYLYLAPVSILIILNFLNFPEYSNASKLWILGLLLLISFNFQQIAQAKCIGCLYPPWSI